MGDGGGKKQCGNHAASSYPVKYPNSTTISLKNLKNGIRSMEGRMEKGNCENFWMSDVRRNHVRNRRLLDSPFSRAKCCGEIYNMIVDRQKLKRLKRFDLTGTARSPRSDLEPEIPEKCVDAEDMTGNRKKTDIVHVVDECHPVSETDSSGDEDEFSWKTCDSQSFSECSGCETFGEIKRLKIHVLPNSRWQDLVYGNEVKYCQKIVDEIMAKYKGNADAMIKFDKIYSKANLSKIL